MSETQISDESWTPLACYDLSGYEIGEPSPAAAEIDAGIARDACCDECGKGSPMRYRPYIKKKRGRVVAYRAFIVCPECDHAVEF